jgi:hypothetical protein
LISKCENFYAGSASLTILKKWQNCLKEKRKFIFSVILFVKNLKILWKRKMQKSNENRPSGRNDGKSFQKIMERH